jgi:hypothetical protein
VWCILYVICVVCVIFNVFFSCAQLLEFIWRGKYFVHMKIRVNKLCNKLQDAHFGILKMDSATNNGNEIKKEQEIQEKTTKSRKNLKLRNTNFGRQALN